MQSRKKYSRLLSWGVAWLALAGVLVSAGPAPAQEELASPIKRYRDREVSTGYYERYEVRPLRQQPLVESTRDRRGLFPYSPTAASVRSRYRLADSHQGLKFYESRTCQDCHAEQARDIHTVRANLTCRQCHGGEPVASINHYYSLMNPIRRHAYVCAKCHPGASASFAQYRVHEPRPGRGLETFPALFYVFWVMVGLVCATFVLFLPHTFLWGLRELFRRKEKRDDE